MCMTVCIRLSNDLVHLIATMVYSPLSELKIVMIDVEKQSNGSDCGVLSIAYAFQGHSQHRGKGGTCLLNL